MPGPEPRTPLDPENLRIAFDLMGAMHRLAGLRRRPGVRKFRSWNELLLAREREEQELTRGAAPEQ
jgi:hypothetical protein